MKMYQRIGLLVFITGTGGGFALAIISQLGARVDLWEYLAIGVVIFLGSILCLVP